MKTDPKKSSASSLFSFFRRPKAVDPKSLTSHLEDLRPKTKNLLREYWYALVAALVVFVPLYVFIFSNLPSPTRLRSDAFPTSTKILDRNGKLLFEVYSDQNRTPVPLDELPQDLIDATISIEDKNFYRHHGIAPEGILRAAWNTLFKQRLQGGSTITQQLVKTVLLTPERTIQRKIREVVLSLATEIIYSKDQIMEMYLNFTPYGGIAYGVEAASALYFDKPAKDLTLAEAALIAGLPQAPTRYSPFGSNPENAQLRQKEVLRRMQEDGYITEDERLQAESEELHYATGKIAIQAPHFALYVKDLLVEEYGAKTVEAGGLTVTTSLDLDLQEAAQASLSAEVATLESLRVSNGAALVTKPASGEILAMIGSKDYFDVEADGQVNVTLRPRQPGSSIKPLNYAGALASGLTPATVILDIPTCFSSTNQPLYCPKNYDGNFHGPVSVRDALANSYNIPAVRVLAVNKIEDMIATASAMGITGWDDPSRYGLSLTLGGGEVKMVDMAVAFGTFANGGVKVPLHPILKVEDQNGQVLQEYIPPETIVTQKDCQDLVDCQNWTIEGEPVIPKEIAYLISHILQDNPARTPAFGPSSSLSIRNQIVSAKTGTTNDLRDNWTIGYTPDFLVATWVGNNDNTPMSYLTSGITGAAPIWHDIMSYVLQGRTATWPPKPENIISATVCSLSGLLPSPDRPCSTKNELFIEGTLPQETDHSTRGIWINKDTNLPAFTGEIPPDQVSTDNLELREHTILSDPLTRDFCLSCPWPQELSPEGTPSGKIAYPQQTINLATFYGQPQFFQLPTPAPSPTQ